MTPDATGADAPAHGPATDFPCADIGAGRARVAATLLELPAGVVTRNELRTVAGDEPAGLRETLMLRDEVRARHAVAIAENDVVGARRGERAVADRRRAKSAVFVPHVSDRKIRARFEGVDDLACRRRRTVVATRELAAVIGLSNHTTLLGRFPNATCADR